MREQIVAQSRTEAHCCLCREKLCCQRTGQTDDSQQHQQSPHLSDIHGILIPDPHINDLCHHQRNKQLKAGLQHFEQRPEHTLELIAS